jgi:NaMN:DMB phosphoribosyltransferase
MPDESATEKARQRLDSLDLGVGAPAGLALGALCDTVAFVAGAQGNPFPRPLLALRVLLLKADHAGGVAAGPTPDPRQATPLRHLAGMSGAGLVTLELAAAGAIETGDAASTEVVDAAMRSGWAEAERAADEGIELIVLAAGGAGAATAATAVVAAVTGAEPTSLLGRVATPDGMYDDEAWMARCLAVRDGLRRVRGRNGDPRQVLTALGGADLAAATGLLLGAANRRTPVMIDGPVGVAAGLLARDFAFTSRQWLLLADHGEHPTVRLGADVLGLRPFASLRLDLGEGGTSLAVLPLLQTALTLASKGSSREGKAAAPEAGDPDAG